MHSANRKHSALSPFPVVHQYNYEKVYNIPSEGPLDVYFIGDEPHYRAESIEQDEKWCDWVDRHVEVGDTLKKLQPLATDEWVVEGEEHL